MIAPKAIDIQSINAIAKLSNNIPFISFGYLYYENFNTQTGEWNSYVVKEGNCSYNEISWSLENNTDGQTSTLIIKMSGTRK